MTPNNPKNPKDFLESVNLELQELLKNVNLLCEKFNKENELLIRNSNDLKTAIELNKDSAEKLAQKELKLQEKLDESEAIKRNLLQEKQQLEQTTKELNDLERKLDMIQERINKDSFIISEERSNLDKREKWNEMEERRLTFLDKRLKLLIEDKEISKKLKELE